MGWVSDFRRAELARSRTPGGMSCPLVGVALALAFTAGGASDAHPQAEIPEVARERLEYAIGEWSIVGERLRPDGSVADVTEAEQIATWLVPGQIVQMRDRDPNGGGRSWWVYDHGAAAWTLVSIGVGNGAVWVLKGTLDEWVITSEPRELPRGGSMMIRFTHFDIEPESFRALQEVSRDGGATWRAVYRQTLTRMR